MVAEGALAGGSTIDLDGERTITDAPKSPASSSPRPTAARRWASSLSDGDGVRGADRGRATSTSCRPRVTPTPLSTIAGDYLLKSGWNYLLLDADGSLGVHNPDFADGGRGHQASLAEIAGGGGIRRRTPTRWPAPRPTSTGPRSRPANGAAGSVWRTDVVAKNNADTMANVEFNLHTDSHALPRYRGPSTPVLRGSSRTSST